MNHNKEEMNYSTKEENGNENDQITSTISKGRTVNSSQIFFKASV